MRGRKPTPTKFRELVGNPQRRSLNRDEPQYPPGAGDPPELLDENGRVEWERVCRMMVAAGVITQADRAVLTIYCAAWSRWLKATAAVTISGEVLRGADGGVYQNPYLAVANKAAEQVAKLSAALGLDPTARTRLHPQPVQGGPQRVASRPKTKQDGKPPPKD